MVLDYYNAKPLGWFPKGSQKSNRAKVPSDYIIGRNLGTVRLDGTGPRSVVSTTATNSCAPRI